MLLSTIFVVAREMLEAAYVGGLLMALLQFQAVSKKAGAWGLLGGVLGALVFAVAITELSATFQGRGYEIWVSSLYAVVALGIALAVVMVWFGQPGARVLEVLVSVAWGLTLVKEVGEILLYLLPSIGGEGTIAVLFGAFVGLLIGLSGGALVFLVLMRFHRHWMKGLMSGLLAFLAGGLLMHCVGLLTQAGILPYQARLYSMHPLLAEESLMGHLLQGIFYYEASPTLNQVVAYWLVVVGVLVPVFPKWRAQRCAKP